MLQLPHKRPKRFALIALSLFFILAGANHFANADFYLRLMPDYLPAHLELVYISGFFEMAGGVGVLVPYLRSIAGWGLGSLLRMLVLMLYAVVGTKALGLVAGPALMSLVAFLFVTMLVEPLFLKQ